MVAPPLLFYLWQAEGLEPMLGAHYLAMAASVPSHPAPLGAVLGFTWEWASTVLRQVPEHTFQMRMCRSLVPPPVARTLDCQGHQATACQKRCMTVRT